MAINFEKLSEYGLEDYNLLTGFSSFEDAEIFANENGGELVEVAFKDGNDNPKITSTAGLVEKKVHFFADAGPEYQFIHSTDEKFQEYADEISRADIRQKTSSPEEQYFANFKIETGEDPVIVLKNYEFESVTTRERAKYLKQATVYEIAVKQMK